MLPVLKPHEVIHILERLGFEQIRQHGSHRQFKHADGRQTTVPDHRGHDLSPFLLYQITKNIRVTMEEFLRHR